MRGALEAFRAIAELARWERRHDARLANGPWRREWPTLAADRTSFGMDLAAPSGTGRRGVALSERESLALAARAGIPVTTVLPVTDAAGAVEAARKLRRPVALKLDVAGLAHKSEVGGVVLGLDGDDEVYAAALKLLETGRHHTQGVVGLLVEPMAHRGVELILGLRRDPHFGPAVLAGLGGTMAEVLDDVQIRLAPLEAAAAEAMLDALRGAALLGGVRGRPPVDRAAVMSMLVALGRLGVERPDILEVDLNPVIASASGAVAVDALVVVEAPPDARA
jgi:acyl-CoA synthetase (NDP forming)